jgi:ribonuclease R
MKEHEGETFEGIISNVTSFGMFIELDNTIEGLIRMSMMEDDYYIFNEKQYCLVGERTRKIYRIGDTLSVKLAKADLATRKIDFTIVDEKGNKTVNREKGHGGEVIKSKHRKSSSTDVNADSRTKRGNKGKKKGRK